jgi:RNA-binding protein
MPTGALRRALRGHGHALRPIVHIGKSGVTSGLLAQLAQVLFDHELVKVRIASECPTDRFAVAEELSLQPGTQIVQILGHTLVVYKRHPEKPRYEGAAAKARAAGAPETPEPPKRAKRPAMRASKNSKNPKYSKKK